MYIYIITTIEEGVSGGMHGISPSIVTIEVTVRKRPPCWIHQWMLVVVTVMVSYIYGKNVRIKMKICTLFN